MTDCTNYFKFTFTYLFKKKKKNPKTKKLTPELDKANENL